MYVKCFDRLKHLRAFKGLLLLLVLLHSNVELKRGLLSCLDWVTDGKQAIRIVDKYSSKWDLSGYFKCTQVIGLTSLLVYPKTVFANHFSSNRFSYAQKQRFLILPASEETGNICLWSSLLLSWAAQFQCSVQNYWKEQKGVGEAYLVLFIAGCSSNSARHWWWHWQLFPTCCGRDRGWMASRAAAWAS